MKREDCVWCPDGHPYCASCSVEHDGHQALRPGYRTQSFTKKQYQSKMIKIISLLCVLPLTQGLLQQRVFLSPHHHRASTSLSADQVETDTENPCWQDMYDDDCSMDKTYAASFVASEWLKKMPCAKGIEVRNGKERKNDLVGNKRIMVFLLIFSLPWT